MDGNMAEKEPDLEIDGFFNFCRRLQQQQR
jgi:hypothetical protein